MTATSRRIPASALGYCTYPSNENASSNYGNFRVNRAAGPVGSSHDCGTRIVRAAQLGRFALPTRQNGHRSCVRSRFQATPGRKRNCPAPSSAHRQSSTAPCRRAPATTFVMSIARQASELAPTRRHNPPSDHRTKHGPTLRSVSVTKSRRSERADVRSGYSSE